MSSPRYIYFKLIFTNPYFASLVLSFPTDAERAKEAHASSPTSPTPSENFLSIGPSPTHRLGILSLGIR